MLVFFQISEKPLTIFFGEKYKPNQHFEVYWNHLYKYGGNPSFLRWTDSLENLFPVYIISSGTVQTRRPPTRRADVFKNFSGSHLIGLPECVDLSFDFILKFVAVPCFLNLQIHSKIWVLDGDLVVLNPTLHKCWVFRYDFVSACLFTQNALCCGLQLGLTLAIAPFSSILITSIKLGSQFFDNARLDARSLHTSLSRIAKNKK